MTRTLTIMAAMLMSMAASAQENLQKQASNKEVEKVFTTVKELPITSVKNTWGEYGPYKGIWYMSRDYMALNTTYLFLNRQALTKGLRKAVGTCAFH
ncbi:hypothetical protein [uncultured Prevotella sp.]|uniref:hypothetical protein n=1 Tax=uncultured Prevotella sp. TaxID=159272 RepID=UPI0025D8E912|nr:hypothetical protein [uncultured Prevotella sp.]